MKKIPTISACILTYNSESTIKQAVDSVRPYVDQVVIVDSGSTDQTLPILQSLGLQAHSFQWCDDFSAARNFAIAQATSQWILFLDSDETFHWNDSEHTLPEYLADQDDPQSIYLIPVRNLEEATGELLLISHAERLFPRELYTYQGAIHETLTGPAADKRLLEHGEIEHVGYSASRMAGKADRNLRILERELAADPADGKLHRYLANEYFNLDQFEKSIEHARRALELLPRSQVYLRAQSYYYWMVSWLFQGEMDRALQVAGQAEAEIPAYSDPYAIEFDLAFHRQDWRAAIAMFTRWEALVSLDDILPRHFAGYHHAFLLKKAQAHLYIGETEAARTALLQLLAQEPSHAEAIHLYKQLQRSDSAERQVYGMKLSVAVMGLYDAKEFIEIKQHLDTLPCDYEMVDVGAWDELPAQSTAEEQQRAALRLSRHEWVLFLTAQERLADIESFAALLDRAVTEQKEYYTAKVTYATDRLQVPSWQVRLAKRTVKLESVKSPMPSSAAFEVNSRFLYTGLPHKFEIANNPMLVADLAQGVLSDLEAGLRNGLYEFARQQYETSLRTLTESAQEDGDVQRLRANQFFRVLSQINLGQANEALELLQDVINADDEEAIKDFCYLYAKMVLAIDDVEVKQEAFDLLQEVCKHYQEEPGRFVQLDDAEMLIIAGDLQMQLQRLEQAKHLYFEALVLSNYENERAAYRYADTERQLAERSNQLQELPRKIMAELNLGGPQAKRILYVIFRYLGLDEWALLFYSFHESTRYTKPEGKASVLLPVYNQSHYLRDSIRSVLHQSYTNFELILIDDGSTENVKEIVEEFWYDRRIRYHRLETNMGLPSALNAGLELATGEFLTWHSADNIMHEQLLERLLAALETDTDKVAAFANYRHIDENGLTLEKRLNRSYELNGLATPGPAFVWRGAYMNEVGGFDTELFGIEDRDFAIRLRMQGAFELVPETLYSYRIHGDSLSAEIEQERFGGWNALHHKLKQKWFFWNFL